MDIINILDKNNIIYEIKNNEVIMKCLNDDHNDGKPSMSYNLSKNVFNCWSCGYRGGQRKFLSHFGIITNLQVSTRLPFKIEKIKSKLRDKYFDRELRIPEDAMPISGKIRNISKFVTNEFKAFWTKYYNLEDYICFPVYQYEKLKFIEARLITNDISKPKYLRLPKSVNMSSVLFPLDKLSYKNHVFLVEGIFDLLNMYQHGYTNTLCCFGVNNISKERIDILKSINCNEITLFFDGDSAGKKSAESAKNILEKHDIKTYIVYCPLDKDPGDLTEQELRELLEE